MSARATLRSTAAAVAKAAALEQLRLKLPATVDLLHHRQAGKIDDVDIEDYVKLHWLEWHGGGLRLTITGRNVCAQMTSAAT
jgi:hypothetical protein